MYKFSNKSCQILKKIHIFAPRNFGNLSLFAKYEITNSGCSVARLSRHVWDVEAAGSNPATPTF